MSNLSSSSNAINTVLTSSKLVGDRCFFPSSYQQQGLWLVEQMNPGHATYNIPFGCYFYGELDINALEQALQILIKKYETFRTIFGAVDGTVSQIVWDEVNFSLPYIEIEDIVSVDSKESALSLANLIVQQTFDITADPLFRFALIRIRSGELLFVASIHHMVFDGVSIHPFLSELGDLYTQIATIQKDESSLSVDQVEIQYADYAVWQRERLSEDYEAKLINFWKKELEDVNTLLELPSDYPRPAVQTFDGDHVEINFEPGLIRQLTELANDRKTSLYVVILSALYVLLYRYTKQDTILIGTPFADRSLAELESAIGFFTRSIILKGDLTNKPTFSELILRVRESVLTAQENQDLPFETLVKKLQPTRDRAFNPYFQVMFGLQSLSSAPIFGNIENRLIRLSAKTSMFDLFFDLREECGRLLGVVEFSTSLFEKESIVRMVAQYEKTLQEVVMNPEQPIWQIPILPEKERNQILNEWNDTYSEFPDDKCIHQLFESQVTSNKTALVTPAERLTYEELNQRANRLAHYLLSLGVKPEERIGVYLERNVDLIVSLLAVLKAGGAYVALDPAYPPDRNTFTIADSGAQIVITFESLQSDLVDSAATLVCLDQKRAEIEAHASENVNANINSRNLAYVIYTSGSTGKPKGVAIEHRSAVALCSWAAEMLTPEDYEGMLLSTSLCFDVSVFELFFPLSVGAKVILVDNILHVDSIETASEITLISTVPSAMQELVRAHQVPQSVRTLVFAGEPLSAKLVNEMYELDHIEKVYDFYGPSEDTTYSTATLRRPNATNTIGKPISNAESIILDQYKQLVPIGVPGELHLGGVGLAREYLGRPALTAERFIRHPFKEDQNARLYCTGDLARYYADGNIEYLGRLDNQVKVRGFRIELGEIESVISDLDSIAHVCAVVQEIRIGDPRIIVYIVLASGKNVTSTEIRQKIRKILPDYMIPQYFVELDRLPIMPNGKIDKKALPSPLAVQQHKVMRVAPRNNKEKILVKIWADILGISPDQISVQNNFFELGGHSLLSMQIISRLSDFTKTEINLRDIIFSSLEQIAEKCEFAE